MKLSNTHNHFTQYLLKECTSFYVIPDWFKRSPWCVILTERSSVVCDLYTPPLLATFYSRNRLDIHLVHLFMKMRNNYTHLNFFASLSKIQHLKLTPLFPWKDENLSRKIAKVCPFTPCNWWCIMQPKDATFLYSQSPHKEYKLQAISDYTENIRPCSYNEPFLSNFFVKKWLFVRASDWGESSISASVSQSVVHSCMYFTPIRLKLLSRSRTNQIVAYKVVSILINLWFLFSAMESTVKTPQDRNTQCSCQIL